MVMKFIEKIRQITKEAKSIEHAYPLVTKVIKEEASRGNHGCYMQLTPEQIEACARKAFK